MKNLPTLFLIAGCLLILLAVVLRVMQIPFFVGAKPIKASSLLILANTSFILAVLFKK